MAVTEKLLVDAKEAAQMLGVHYSTLQRLVRTGRLKCVWMGVGRGRMRFRPETLAQWVKEQER